MLIGVMVFMRKVGIITMFNLNNYGNRLQAYALSEVVENLKCKAVELHYCDNGIKSLIKEIYKRNRFLLDSYYFLTGILKSGKFSFAVKNCKRFNLFFEFSKKIKSQIVFSDTPSFDYYLCGSDQIWNPNFACKSSYFAAFAPKEKRISYAASFGISTLPEGSTEKYRKNLNDMQHISVREHQGAEIVKQLTGREAQVLIDPTLMIDRDGWRAVAKKPKFKVEGKYILTYFLSKTSEETDAYIKKIAKENNLQIISLHRFEENDYWYYTGPSEFIWLIENASLVCTDSFHASIFSILMDSPFIVFRREYKNNDMHSRLENLLVKFNLTDRFFERLQGGAEFKKDYSHVSEILNLEREKAIKFLTNALNLNDRGNKND